MLILKSKLLIENNIMQNINIMHLYNHFVTPFLADLYIYILFFFK